MTRFTYEVRYEWAVEEEDEEGDIVDVSFWDTYAEAVAQARRGEGSAIALVYSLWRRPDDELVDRAYAYVEGGELPEEFDNGKRVPKRFAREVE